MRKKLMISVLFGSGLVLASCTAEAKESVTETNLETVETPITEKKVTAKEVEGFVLEESTFLIPVNTVGNVRAINKGKLSAQVSGIFKCEFIYEGQTFHKNEIIGSINDADFDIRYRKGHASFERKYIDFLNNDIIPKDFVNLKPDVLFNKIKSSSDKSIWGRARTTGLYEELLNVQALEQEKQLRKVRVSQDLVITKINVENGQNVGKGTALFDYVSDKDKVVEAALFESESAYLTQGEKVLIKRHAVQSSEEFIGEVIGISKQISKDRFRNITIKLESPEHLIDGEQVDVRVKINTNRSGLQVPNESIVYRDQRPVVFVEENGQALWKYIELGERFGDMVEVTSGIQSGNKVITKGHFTLAHMANVTITLK